MQRTGCHFCDIPPPYALPNLTVRNITQALSAWHSCNWHYSSKLWKLWEKGRGCQTTLQITGQYPHTRRGSSWTTPRGRGKGDKGRRRVLLLFVLSLALKDVTGTTWKGDRNWVRALLSHPFPWFWWVSCDSALSVLVVRTYTRNNAAAMTHQGCNWLSESSKGTHVIKFLSSSQQEFLQGLRKSSRFAGTGTVPEAQLSWAFTS